MDWNHIIWTEEFGVSNDEIKQLEKQQFFKIAADLDSLASSLDVDIPIITDDCAEFLRYAALNIRSLYDRSESLYQECAKHRQFVRKRDEQSAALRAFLSDVGVPEYDNGKRLSLLQRIVWLTNRREI